MDKPVLGPETTMRMVGRTTNLEEANRLAERYEAEGFETEIRKIKQAGIVMYEVWIGKKADIFSAPARPPGRSIE